MLENNTILPIPISGLATNATLFQNFNELNDRESHLKKINRIGVVIKERTPETKIPPIITTAIER